MIDKSLQDAIDQEFANAGQNGTRLGNVLRKNLNERQARGEVITIKDVEQGIYKIEEAYATILEIASGANNPANVIAKAITSMETQITATGSIDSIQQVAKEVAIEEIRREDKVIETPEGVVEQTLAAEIATMPMTTLENIYNAETIESINKNYEAASKGDIGSIAKVNEVEKLTYAAATQDQLDDKAKRGMLARMMRISTLEDAESNQILTEIADKYGIDIFTTDENGERKVDYAKLEKEYHDAVYPVNPKAAEKTREDFKNLVATSAKQEFDKGTFSEPGRTIQGAMKQKHADRALVKFEQRMSKAYRENDTDTIRQLIQLDPEKAKQMVSNLIKWQENPKLSREKAMMIQKEAMDLGSVLRDVTQEKSQSVEAEPQAKQDDEYER